MGYLSKAQPTALIDPDDPQQSSTGVVENPLRVDPTGTTVQPVSVVSSAPAGTLNGTNQVDIGTEATLIIAANPDRSGVLITNPSATVTIYIGTAAVTASTGSILPPLQSLTLPVSSAIYGVVADGSQTISYVEVV